MYWFTIHYYDNTPEQYYKPLTMLSDKRQVLMVYAATPQQATEVAEKLIAEDPYEYNHHVPHIRLLCSCVHEDEMSRWQADHAC